MVSRNENRLTKRENKKGGATVSKVGMADRVQSWTAHHRSSAAESLGKLLATPVQSLMTWLVIGIALALPCGLFLLIENINTLGERWDGNPRATVFLKQEISDKQVDILRHAMEVMVEVGKVEFISRESALEEFQSSAGFGEVLDLLDENPLPAVFIVEPKNSLATTVELAQLADSLQQLEGVDFVQMDLEWVQKLQHIIGFAQRFAFLLGVLLALGILLTVGNTIRLAIENRRAEIVVVKLVGGTDAFVRRPLLYTGIWYGLIGGIVAWFMVFAGTLVLSGPVADLAALYGSDFSIRGLGFLGVFQLLSVATLLGLTGAWVAVARHLNDIQPR